MLCHVSDPSHRQGRPPPPTDRVLAVLEAVAADPSRRCALNQLVTHAGLTKSTCPGIVTALVERGCLSTGGARGARRGPRHRRGGRRRRPPAIRSPAPLPPRRV